MENLLKKARYLRKNLTTQERKIWDLFRNHRFYGLEFRRQHIIGNYIVDFVSLKYKIIIEIDGGQHNEELNLSYDKERTEFLNSKGYKVFRFWNNDVDNNIEAIYEKLKKIFAIDVPHPHS